MPDPAISLLQRLVSIDSVNPSLVSGGAGEGEIAGAIAADMLSFGLKVEISEVRPGRPNVVGVLEGKSRGKSLMLCGHTDTVGVTGMKAPFEPAIRDDRLFGRGSQDMKAGVAAMISAARALAESGGLAAGKLIVAAVIDEEYESIGAEALVKKWRADAAVVTEPTDLMIAVGHKGFSWAEVTTYGRAAHGSRPEEGRDAILRMGHVLSRLELLNREIQARPPHPNQGTGSLHASIIDGGRELSSYPDRCVLKFERRTISGEPVDMGYREAQAIIEALKKTDKEFEASAKFGFGRPAFETPLGHPLPEFLAAAMRKIGREPKQGGVSFWTDAAILASAGIPGVVFGPGGHGLHSLEEYVRVDEVIACKDALVELARLFCSSPG